MAQIRYGSMSRGPKGEKQPRLITNSHSGQSGLVVSQLDSRYGSITASDWERAAIPAHAAPAALHRDWLFSASGNGPVPSRLRFSARLGNVVVADCSQNPAARMENTQTLNCKRLRRFIVRTPFFNDDDNLANLPKPIGHASSHCRLPQRPWMRLQGQVEERLVLG